MTRLFSQITINVFRFSLFIFALLLAATPVFAQAPDPNESYWSFPADSRLSHILPADLNADGLAALKLAIVDGALGALRQVCPQTEEQRCWVHKIANILNKLPKRLQPRAKSHLHEIMRAPDKTAALEEVIRFQAEYQDMCPTFTLPWG